MPPKAKAASPNKLLRSQQSTVHAQDDTGNVFKGFQVWISLDNPGADGTLFQKCLVLPGTNADTFKVKALEPPSDTEMEVSKSRCYNLNQNLDPFGFDDIGTLPHSNSPCVLDFLKQRLTKGQIYSTADPLIVALNPFKNLNNAGTDVIVKYRDVGDVSKMPPHVFTAARSALESLHMVKKSQTIVVSGESGAGKTEATKQVMRYFAAAKSGSVDLRIQTAILAANPVLEAFGNAKTVRNNNSSRFGRFMMLDVAASGGIRFGTVRNFLLEKSRVLHQEKEERNYHIFYQLLKGAQGELRTKLKLLDLKSYKFINPLCQDVEGVDDLAEWKDVDESLESMGMTKDQKEAVFSIVSGVMLMGNVEVEGQDLDGVPEACVLSAKTKSVFQDACSLLYLDADKVETAVTKKVTLAGGKEIHGRWGMKDGEILIHSLAKAMYEKLFFWIVVALNVNIAPPSGWQEFMGMLDIFGFEVFQNNSLEQLFINITNEALQKNFTDVVFQKESKLYREEGISSADLVFTSNDEVIKCLIDKKQSIMAALDDQCLAPSGNDEKFLSNAHNMLKGNAKMIKPKLAGNIMFIVDHTIGEIQYNVQGFLHKNKDVLRSEIVEVIQASSNPTCAALFEGVTVEKGKMKGNYIGAQYMKQLEELMGLINSTETHFVRCVKPNDQKAPLQFDQAKVLIQLHSLSILEALQLRNLGYSYRRPFKDFLFQFRFIDLAIAQSTTLAPEEAARKLMECTKITSGWQVGKSMLFLKPQVAKDLVQKQRQAMAAWKPLCAMIEAFWAKTEAKEKVAAKEKFMIRLQAQCRKKLAGKVAPPNFQQAIKGW